MLDLDAIRADLDALEALGCEYVVLRGLEDAIELDKSSAKSEDQS
ncbi:MAG: hypothetical protein PHI12_13640 [Dehalococcoidales bacterium]|nr:hypothetical protein [Dehalococcoidales bacterium]